MGGFGKTAMNGSSSHTMGEGYIDLWLFYFEPFHEDEKMRTLMSSCGLGSSFIIKWGKQQHIQCATNHRDKEHIWVPVCTYLWKETGETFRKAAALDIAASEEGKQRPGRCGEQMKSWWMCVVDMRMAISSTAVLQTYGSGKAFPWVRFMDMTRPSFGWRLTCV